jgi:hypothetical protein
MLVYKKFVPFFINNITAVANVNIQPAIAVNINHGTPVLQYLVPFTPALSVISSNFQLPLFSTVGCRPGLM